MPPLRLTRDHKRRLDAGRDDYYTRYQMREVCNNGHPLTDDAAIYFDRGGVRCVQCRRDAFKRWYRRHGGRRAAS